MIRRMADKSSYVGMVISNDSEEEDLMFCQSCRKDGTMSKLKPMIYLDDNGKLLPPPPDADNFKRCYKCGLVVPVREVMKQGKISGVHGIEPIENPYDYGKGVILGNDSKHRYQNLKRRQNKHPDKEVQKHIYDGYELTS
jgi:hypothetical protein